MMRDWHIIIQSVENGYSVRIKHVTDGKTHIINRIPSVDKALAAVQDYIDWYRYNKRKNNTDA